MLLFAFSCGAQEPPWEECRAASKTEYESAKRDFLLQTKRPCICNDRLLVAALLLVLSVIVVGAGNAATSLPRLWRDQGNVQQARKLLAPVYGCFTEGHDTRDLKEKALLEQLVA